MPNLAMIRVWHLFRERKGVGLSELITRNEGLRYVPAPSESQGTPTAVKSVTYDTKLLIIEDNQPKVVEIGEWINSHLNNQNNTKSIVQYGPEDANMELLDISKLDKNAFILSTDMDGKVGWHHITNVTRHDPSEFIYKIRTKWGREVEVVASKSLLIWNEEIKEFEVKNSEDVKIGDKVPTTFNSPKYETIVTHVDMSAYFPKNEYVYGRVPQGSRQYARSTRE